MRVQSRWRQCAAISTSLIICATSRADAQRPLSAPQLVDLAERAMARGAVGACDAIDFWKRSAVLYRRAGDSAQEAAINRRVGGAYALVDEPDSALVYTGRSMVGDSASTGVAEILTESPLLDPSRSLPEEGAFIERVRAYVNKLLGNDVAARRVNTVADAHEALERVSGARLAKLRITGDSPGVVVRYIRYTLRERSGILPEQARTDTTILRPGVAYRFWYKQTTGRDTIVDLQCVNNCELVVVRGVRP
jgi:hypothetical protein